MIRYLPILAATVIGALGAGAVLFVVFEKQKREQRSGLQAKEKEITSRLKEKLGDSDTQASEQREAIRKLQQQLLDHGIESTAGGQAPPRSKVVDDPNQVIELLANLDVEGDYANRRAVHYFETLVDIGPPAVPTIREFLDREPAVDLVFSLPEERRDRFNRRSRGDRERKMQEEIRESDAINYFQPFPKPNSGFPPTLRLGLLEATSKVGGKEAESLLINVLRTSAAGVEVAYLDIALEEIEPGKYRGEILKKTRDILADPPPESNATKFDERSKGYLYAILVKYKDEEFVEIAKDLLVSDDGKLDGYALLYLRQVLGERALPIFLDAYRNGNITNKWEKAAISDAAMHYVGRNVQADEIWREMMKDGFKSMQGEDMFSEKRYEKLFLPVVSLARDMEDQNVDTIKARRKLLGEARKGSADILLQFGLTMLDRRMGEVQKKKEEDTEQ